MKDALILCSGGIDSVVSAYLVAHTKKHRNYAILFFDYGQQSRNLELKFSKDCAKNIGASFRHIKLPELARITGPLVPKEIVKITRKDLSNLQNENSKWYVPCRNTLFLTHALAIAEKNFLISKFSSDLFVGFKSEGRNPYPDTTQDYLDKMNVLAQEICAYPFRIHAPLIKKDKEDIIQLGIREGVDLTRTVSCYAPQRDKHCGKCMACALRHAGFYWAGIEDPTRYVTCPL